MLLTHIEGKLKITVMALTRSAKKYAGIKKGVNITLLKLCFFKFNFSLWRFQVEVFEWLCWLLSEIKR